MLYDENQLGQAYVENGKAAQGISLLEKTLAASREILGFAVADTLRVEVSLGWAYDSQGELARAGQFWQHAFDGYRRLGSFQESNAAGASELLGQNLTKQRKYAQAEPLLRQALAFREKGDRDKWSYFRTQAFLGAALAGLGRYAEAEPLLLSGYDGLQQRFSRMPAKEQKWIRSSGEHTVDLYSQWHKPEQAAQWRAKAGEAPIPKHSLRQL
jgi:eukaryotic-like serine/threonine-protein kinase